MEKTIKVGVLVVKEGQALLIKEWSEDKKNYYWNIIKGTFDDQTDSLLVDCAVREAKEESGITILVNQFIGIVVKYGFSIRIYINFLASVVDGEPHIVSQSKQSLRKENIKEVRWFSRSELKSMKEDEFINDVAYGVVEKWLSNEIYPLSLLTEKNLRN